MAEFTFPVLLLLGFIGCFAGFLAGLLGLGGGIIYIPMFLWAFGVFKVAPEVIVHVAFGTTSASFSLPRQQFPCSIFAMATSILTSSPALPLAAPSRLLGAKLASLTPGIAQSPVRLMLLAFALRFFSPSPFPEKNEEKSLPLWFASVSPAMLRRPFRVSGAVVSCRSSLY